MIEICIKFDTTLSIEQSQIRKAHQNIQQSLLGSDFIDTALRRFSRRCLSETHLVGMPSIGKAELLPNAVRGSKDPSAPTELSSIGVFLFNSKRIARGIPCYWQDNSLIAMPDFVAPKFKW